MIAAHGNVKPARVRIPASLNFTDTAPVDLRWIAVLLITGDDTALASDALRHVEMEPVLLAGLRRASRHQRWRGRNRAAHAQ